MTTVATALAAAKARLPASEARLLLGHVMRRPAAWLIAHDEAPLDEDSMLVFASLVARRGGGEPVAYLLGHREFFGRDFGVTPAVLIPRPETELLVEVALATLGRIGVRRDEAGNAPARVLDLGTGSGCIAITVALEMPMAQVSAVDISHEALAVARASAAKHGAAVRWLQGDWYAGLEGERFDVIVANPPYIPAADPHLGLGDLRHEPAAALASGADGLDAIRRVIGDAATFLAPGGWLWLEHGYDQGAAVLELLTAAGFADIGQHLDLAGIVRVSGGRL